MINILISKEEYKKAIDEAWVPGNFGFADIPSGFPVIATLYSYPVYPKDNYFILFVACEYCRKAAGLDRYNNCARCGGPLSGTPLIRRTTDGAILPAILEMLSEILEKNGTL